MDEKLRVKVVRVVHVDVTIKLVETVTFWVVQWRWVTDTPFSEAPGLVTVVSKHLGEGDVAWLQLSRTVASDPGMAGM